MASRSIPACCWLPRLKGTRIQTIEALGEHPEQGWKITEGLHPLQQAFVESGAIQCGYCTPAQILAAKELLEQQPDPDRSRGARCALGRVVPLHGLSQAGAGGAARGGQCCAAKKWSRLQSARFHRGRLAGSGLATGDGRLKGRSPCPRIGCLSERRRAGPSNRGRRQRLSPEASAGDAAHPELRQKPDLEQRG